MSENKLQGWALTRTMGRKAFVRKYGIIYLGIPTAILWAFAMLYASGFSHLPILLALALLISPISGFGFGHMLWEMNEWLSNRSGRSETR